MNYKKRKEDVAVCDDVELMEQVWLQNKKTEKVFEEEVCSDAAKEGYRLVERMEMYNNRIALYTIVARFEDSKGNNAFVASDDAGIKFWNKGTFEVCKALFDKALAEARSFWGTADGHPANDAVCEKFKIFLKEKGESV